jgi:hypothetical protein
MREPLSVAYASLVFVVFVVCAGVHAGAGAAPDQVSRDVTGPEPSRATARVPSKPSDKLVRVPPGLPG